MQEQPSERFVMRNVLSEISQNSKENIRAEISFLVRLIKTLQICKFIKKRRCFLVNFGKFVRTLTLQRIASRLLLITAVSVGKGELVNKTVNYDTKTKAQGPIKPKQFGSPAERKGFRNIRSQLFFKIGVFKSFANSTGKHLCRSIFLISCRPDNRQLH